MLRAKLLVLSILYDQPMHGPGPMQHGAGGWRGGGLNIYSLAAISLSVFPVLASVTNEAASIIAGPLLLTHMSKAAPVTLVTSLHMQHIH